MRWVYGSTRMLRSIVILTAFIVSTQSFAEGVLLQPTESPEIVTPNISSCPLLYDDGNGGLITLYLARGADRHILVKATKWELESGWSQPYVLSTPTRSASSLTMVMNKNSKRGLAAWCSFDLVTGVHYVEAVEYDSQSGFGVLEVLSEATEDVSFGDLKVALDDKHNKAVLWSISPSSNKQVIRCNTGTFGCGWHGAHQVSD